MCQAAKRIARYCVLNWIIKKFHWFRRLLYLLWEQTFCEKYNRHHSHYNVVTQRLIFILWVECLVVCVVVQCTMFWVFSRCRAKWQCTYTIHMFVHLTHHQRKYEWNWLRYDKASPPFPPFQPKQLKIDTYLLVQFVHFNNKLWTGTQFQIQNIEKFVGADKNHTMK